MTEQRLTFLLGAHNQYTLTTELFSNSYDLSLSWANLAGKPVFLRIPYPHLEPMVFYALGRKLPQLSDPAAVNDAGYSCWTYDAQKQEVYLQLRPSKGGSEVVLYNREVTTALQIEGTPIKVRVDTDRQSGQLALAYRAPKEKSLNLTLTNVFGVPYAQPQLHTWENSWHKIMLTAPELINGWYFMETENQLFKGPVSW